MSRSHRIADRWFLGWGVTALVALAVTALSLATGRGAWRIPFVLAHVAALLAFVPLGGVLIVQALAEGYRVAGSLTGTPAAVARRHPLVLLLLAIIGVTVAVSLANFADGTRWLRAVANLVTVAIVLALVARYLRAAQRYEA